MLQSVEFNQKECMANNFCFEGAVSKRLDGTAQVPTLKINLQSSRQNSFLPLKKLLASSKRMSMTRGKQGNIKQNYCPHNEKKSLFIIMKNYDKILIYSDSSSKLFFVK